MNTTFGLFTHQSEAWQAETDEQDEKRYQGPWPVKVWFTATDFLDGYGWRRSKLEKYAKVVADHLYSVGSGDQTQAVLAEVPTEEALVALEKAGFQLWDGEAQPPEL